MKSNQASKAFAKKANAFHAANGLDWNSQEGKELAATIRRYKEAVMAYMQQHSMNWKDWQAAGGVTALFKAVPFDFASLPRFHAHVVLDVMGARVLGRRKAF